MGFVVPWESMGNDDGNMNAVLVGIVGDNTGAAFVDPVPGSGHLTLGLPLVAPPAATTTPPVVSRRAARRPVPVRPLRPAR